MNIRTKDLKNEDWDEDIYWLEGDLVVETKKGQVVFKNSYVRNITFSLDNPSTDIVFMDVPKEYASGE